MKNSFDAFNQKVSLIYEYDNKSPLFVRVGNIELEKNNVDNAISILVEGMNHFPDYPTAYFLLSKAHTIKGNYAQALKYAKRGSELIHSPKSFDYYLREIDAIKKQRTLFNSSRWSDFASKYEDFSLKNESASADKKDEKLNKESIEENLKKLTEEIEGTAKSIQDAKQKIQESRLNQISQNNMIVSETLAKIYVTQGEFKEAISVYNKLIKKNPEKEIYFSSKIEELKALLDTKQI